ncbi:MAG: translation initiation factor IF-2 N-terminal domain-containing protein, partial [Clostridia bacterium]|nr:translation initiation factor IF-2 N-terminal domain-containing protein [Clostridia bacterium]
MIAETKIRINLLAKDLEMKSKDLTDGIAAAGLGTKNSTGTLNADEFSVLLDYLTLQNQISNMGDYLSGKADVKHKEPKVHKVNAEEKPAEPEKAPEKAEQKKPEPKNEAPKKSEEKPAQKKQTVKIPSQPQPERGASKTLDRFAKPNFGSQQSKPQQKPEKKQEQPQKNANIKMGGGETVTAVKKTRVVDTRSSNVDLSKYDERLESFVPDSARRSNVPDRQKLKKQPNKAFPTRKDQDKAGKGKKESTPPKKQKLVISVPDEITVGELAQRLKVTASEVVKRLMMMGVMATVNQEIDYDTAYLIADELGAVVNKEVHVSIEEKLFDVAED